MKLWHASYAVPTGNMEDPNWASTNRARVVKDDFYLPTKGDVRRYILDHGGYPLSIEERREPLVTFFDTRSTAWALSLLRALRFQTQNASAGTALLDVIESEADPNRRVAALPARAVLKGGGTFAEALRAMRLFDAPTMAIISAGEKAGDMREVITYAVKHIEDRQKQGRVFKVALGWLSFDIFSLLSTVAGNQWGFIPYLKSSGMTSNNPQAIEKFNNAMAFAELLNGALMAFCALVIGGGAWVAIAYWRNKDRSEHWSFDVIRRSPAFGAYLRHMSIGDSTRSLSRLARSAVPLHEALEIVETSTVSPEIRDYWRATRERLRSGAPPQRALAHPPLTRVEQNQIGGYTTVDQLAEILDNIADERGLEAKASQRKIVQLGILFLGVVSAAVFGLTLWLVMLQNDGLMQSMSNIRQ